MTDLVTAPSGGPPANIGYRKKIAQDVGAEAPKHAAGICFIAPDGDILLLRRSSAEQNFAGHWAWPGGGAEDGETPLEAAFRETDEEMGFKGSRGKAKALDRRVTPTGTAFHTFAAPVGSKFVPKLNDEHTGYAWASLDMLPRPLHPAVEQTLLEQVGVADDMDPAAAKGARDEFVKWASSDEPDFGATDSALKLALDRDSVRTFDRDGRLKVARAHITKANICPYKGSEIPGWQQLGLEPDRIYQLLRDPDELRKAAHTLNGVPLLRKHIPVSAEDHKADDVVGSIGSNAEFDGDYLDNSLFVNAQEAIDGIGSGEKRELSAGYHYRPDMTPGNFRGNRFDGVMRDIEFNHVALVEDGRAGPDVIVGDSTEGLKMKSTRLAALTLLMTGAHIAPLLAKDAKLTLPKSLFTPITSKTFKENRPKLVAGVKLATDGKLRKGMAFDENALGKLLDALEGTGNGVDDAIEEADLDPAATIDPLTAPPPEMDRKPAAFDAEAVKEFCRGKGMSEDDITSLSGMFPQPATDEFPPKKEGDENDDDEKAKKDKADKEAKDAAMKDMVSKPAMDAALQAHGAAVEKRVRENERGISAARDAVEPWVGKLAASLALDSAEAVHRHALTMLGVEGAATLHADALLPVLNAQPKPGARPSAERNNSRLGMDSAAVKGFNERFPEAARIGNA